MNDNDKIRLAFEIVLAAISAGMPTVYQGRKPPNGFDNEQAHQLAFLLPAENYSLGLSEKTTRHSGYFQVNICYPSGTSGVTEAGERAGALVSNFYAGRELVADGVKVRVRGKPSVAAPSNLSPYTVPVSIRYEAYIRS